MARHLDLILTLSILLEDEISSGLTITSLLSLLKVLSTLSCYQSSDMKVR